MRLYSFRRRSKPAYDRSHSKPFSSSGRHSAPSLHTRALRGSSFGNRAHCTVIFQVTSRCLSVTPKSDVSDLIFAIAPDIDVKVFQGLSHMRDGRLALEMHAGAPCRSSNSWVDASDMENGISSSNPSSTQKVLIDCKVHRGSTTHQSTSRSYSLDTVAKVVLALDRTAASYGCASWRAATALTAI